MSTLFDRKTTEKALARAAEMAKHGTRDEKSGRFLPPAGWKGRVVTAADDGRAEPKKGKAA